MRGTDAADARAVCLPRCYLGFARGDNMPYRLTLPQKAELLLAIEQWSRQSPGVFTALPDGIDDLREGLHNDLRDAR